MTYIKFLDSKNLIPCTVVPNGSIVTLEFQDSVIVDTSGFQLFLDESGEYDVGGSSYLDFKSIYRNDAETTKYNGYQLSNDGSVYKEPILEIPKEPTMEELKNQEKQNKINKLSSQISILKTQLSETDYIFTKNYELMLVGKVTGEYDFEKLHQERQVLRDTINKLEVELKLLMEETE